MTASEHYLVYCVNVEPTRFHNFISTDLEEILQKINERKFKNLMLQSEWGEIETQSSPLSAYTCLESKLNNVLDK